MAREEAIIKEQNALVEHILKDAAGFGDDLGLLQYVFRDAAASLNTRLELYCSSNLSIDLENLRNFKANDFASFIKENALVVRLWAESWNSNIFLIFSIDFVRFATDIFFGNPEPQIKDRGYRLLSQFELKVAEMMAFSITETLNSIFVDGNNANTKDANTKDANTKEKRLLEIISITHNTDFNCEEFSISHFSCCTFKITCKEVGAELQIILPRSCHRPIQESVMRMLHAPVVINNSDPLWSQRIRQEVSKTNITLEAFISQGQITLDELSKFAVGQVICLPIDAAHHVLLRSGKKSLYKCSLGKIENSFSVCIDDLLDKEKEMLDELSYN